MYNRVLPSLLTPRLDADFYKTEFISNEAYLRKFGVKRLAQLIDVKASGYGVLPSSNEYCDDGIPLIRGGDLSFGEIVSPSVFAPMNYKDGKGTAQAGDVLILIKGACIDGPEGIARVKQENHGHLFNGSCFRLAFDNREIDGPFFVAYSQSKFFLKQKKRQVANTGISYNDEDSIHGYLIPELEDSVKKYIGDKVRQAEQLRAWAKRLEQGSSKLFMDALVDLGYKEKVSKKIVRTTLEDRLDPAFYDEKYSFFSESWFIGNTQPLKLFIENGSYGVLPSSSSYGKGNVKFIRATDLKNANIDPTCFTYVPEDEVVDKAKISDGDILMEIKGAISSCELANIHLAGTYVNGSIFRFTSKGINKAYLSYFLSSVIKELYCERVSVNNIISYLDLASIHSLPVVRFENYIEEMLASDFIKINLAKKYAFALTKCAKTLVEALIEGQLAEQQLIQSQQALDDGDNSLDQTILSKLSSEGYAIEGATPLFSDIDELYRLLENAAQAEIEE